jgi:histidinol phosphatase-like enzyme
MLSHKNDSNDLIGEKKMTQKQIEFKDHFLQQRVRAMLIKITKIYYDRRMKTNCKIDCFYFKIYNYKKSRNIFDRNSVLFMYMYNGEISEY